MENNLVVRYQDDSTHEIHEKVVEQPDDLLYFLGEYPSDEYYLYLGDDTAYHMAPAGDMKMIMGTPIKLYHAGEPGWWSVNEVLDFSRFFDEHPTDGNLLVVDHKIFNLSFLGLLPHHKLS